MSLLRQIAVSASVILALTACDDPRTTAPDRHSPSAPSFAISDGAHAGNAHFFFLPPMVKNPSTNGVFDGSLDPTVQICEVAGTSCGAVIATYTKTSGVGSETVQLGDDEYHVNWRTSEFVLDAAKTYRVRVLLLALEIGFVDVTVKTGTRTVPIKFRIEQGVFAGVFVRVSAGVLHSCAIDAAGGAWCWGKNTYGQLGDGTTTDRLTPVPVVPPSGAATSSVFADINAGDSHTCARTVAGEGWCWGMDADGQLGDGPGSAEHCGAYPCSTRPVRVLGPSGSGTPLSFIDIDAGVYFSCGVAVGGAGYCWGFGGDGQLGSVGVSTTNLPHAVDPPDGSITPLNFVDIDAGRLHTCAVAVGGGAWCWGRNTHGQDGNGSFSVDPSFTDTPVAVVPPSGSVTPVSFSNVSATFDGTCGLATDGKAWCWGSSGAGALGDGTTGPEICLSACSTRPVAATGGHLFSIVSTGGANCGLTLSGDAWCWGFGADGRLGDGTTTNSLVPVAVSGGLHFVHLDSGGTHACGTTADGAIWCWGNNDNGQLGNGTTTSSAVPVKVGGV